MFIRAYLRASTKNQDASRAKEDLISFAMEKGHKIASFYIENETGSKIDRKELNRLIDESHTGDVLLIEKMDRLVRVNYQLWSELKAKINEKGINIVVMDLSQTHRVLELNKANIEVSDLELILTNFIIDIASNAARDDYLTRRKRQAQGIEANKEKFRGRPVDDKKHNNIKEFLTIGKSWSWIQEHLGVSRSTIAKVAKIIKEENSRK